MSLNDAPGQDETGPKPPVNLDTEDGRDDDGTVDDPNDIADDSDTPVDRAVDVEDPLARAADRQLEEQRALRGTLAELRKAIESLEAKTDAIDVDDLTEQLRKIMRVSTDTVVAEIQQLGDRAPGTTSRDDAPVTRGLDALKEAVGNTSADIDGIAQALIELNAGLREWADRVERGIESLADNVDMMREDTAAARELNVQTLDEVRSVGEVTASRPKTADAEPSGTAEFREEIEQRIKEAVELSLYLADQIESFDGALAQIADLPSRLEGVVAQGLKRTLAARAKLDTDAQAWLGEALGVVDDHVARMEKASGLLGQGASSVKKLTSGQAQLNSRIDALQKQVLARLDRIEADRRKSEEALTKTIARLAQAKPRAASAPDKAQKPAERKAAKSPPPSRKTSSSRRRSAGPRSGATSQKAGDDTVAE